MEAERTRIVEARKQAENLKRQIIGSARLASRNQELLTIENAVNKAFEEAKKKLQASNSQDSYKDLLKQMIEESISGYWRIEHSYYRVQQNDAEIVRKVVSELQTPVRAAGKSVGPAH